VTLTGRGLDPAALAPAWPGRIDARLQGAVQSAGNGWRIALEELALDGALREQPLTLDAAGRWANGRLRVQRATAELGENRLQIEGKAGETWDLSWSLDARELGAAWPALAGRVSGSGRLTGALQRPRLVAELSAADLHAAGYAADALDASLDIDLSGTRESNADATAKGLSVPGVEAEHVTVHARGRPSAHVLDLEAVTQRAEASLRVAAEWQWQPRRWRFRASEGVLADRAPGDGPAWRLDGDAAGAVTTTGASVERHCWQREAARACLQADADDSGQTFELEVGELPLRVWEPWLPAALAVDGRMDGRARVHLAPGTPAAIEARVTTSEGALRQRVGEDGTDTASLAFRPLEASLSLDRDGGRLRLDAPLVTDGAIALRAELGAGDTLLARSLDGEVTAELANLAPIAELIPEVSRLSGRLDGRLRLGGQVREPRLAGRLTLSDARAVLPRPGLTLTEVGLTLAGDGTGPLRLSGNAVSGDGRLSLDGHVSAAAHRFEARVTGERFKALDTPQARIRVTPDLRLEGTSRTLTLRGELRVPEAEITPRDLAAEGAVTASPDAVIVRESGDERPPLQIDSEVRVILGEAVRFEGFGLTGGVKGNLVVRQPPGELTTATGELTIEDGEYRAYGQGLEIETGRLLFTGGPVTNPGLDVRAVRRPDPDVTVGVRARGTLREPRYSLFSEPAMGQTRQLSWLVLGRPLDETSGGESNMLAKAALSLGIKGADLGAGWLKDYVGLDTFGVENEAGGPREEASFVIGKYLAPDLYVSYGIGIFEPVNVLRIRYEISKRWTLETESGAASGGDIFYSIER